MDTLKIGYLSKYYESKHIPMNCMLELTYSCNFACRHCYVQDGGKTEMMSLETAKYVIDQLKEVGVLKLTITGGEPTLHHQLPEIIEYARRNNMVTSLFTNASRINDELLNIMSQAGTDVSVSLYGSNPIIYKKITGSASNGIAVFSNIQYLLSRHIPVVLKTIATRDTFEDLPSIFKYAESLGLPLAIETLLRPTLGNDSLNDLKLTTEEMSHVFQQFIPKSEPRNSNSSWCGAGTRVICISPAGELYPCANFRYSLGNIHHGSIKEFLASSELLKQVQDNSFNYKAACHQCEAKSFCLACPGLWYTIQKSLSNPWPYNCEISKLRLHASIS